MLYACGCGVGNWCECVVRKDSILVIRSLRAAFCWTRFLIDWAIFSRGFVTRRARALSILLLIFSSSFSSSVLAIFAAMSSVLMVVCCEVTVEMGEACFVFVFVIVCGFFVWAVSDSVLNSSGFRTAMLALRVQAFCWIRCVGSAWERACWRAILAACGRSSVCGLPPYVWTSWLIWDDTRVDVRLLLVRCGLVPSKVRSF